MYYLNFKKAYIIVYSIDQSFIIKFYILFIIFGVKDTGIVQSFMGILRSISFPILSSKLALTSTQNYSRLLTSKLSS